MTQTNYAGLLTRLKEKRNLEKMRARLGFLTPNEKKKLKNADDWIDKFLSQVPQQGKL